MTARTLNMPSSRNLNLIASCKIFVIAPAALGLIIASGCGESSIRSSAIAAQVAETAEAVQEPAADPNLKTDTKAESEAVPTAEQNADPREVGPPDSEIAPEIKEALNYASPSQEPFEIPTSPEAQSDGERNLDEEGNPIPTIEELEAIQQQIEDEFHLQTMEIPKSYKRLGNNHIWIDTRNKKVIARGMICLRRGGLEMFACPRNTKEHESIISVHADSFEVHACLLALGTEPGKPVQWGEEYKPAHGPIIDIEIQWMDDGKLVKRKAQDFVRDFTTKKKMEADWVFGGSVLVKDHVSGEQIYYGDGGELICLSNFATATMDVPVQSSADGAEGLMFEAFTENIPPVNTKVYLVMSERLDESKSPTAPNKETVGESTEPVKQDSDSISGQSSDKE